MCKREGHAYTKKVNVFPGTTTRCPSVPVPFIPWQRQERVPRGQRSGKDRTFSRPGHIVSLSLRVPGTCVPLQKGRSVPVRVPGHMSLSLEGLVSLSQKTAERMSLALEGRVSLRGTHVSLRI